MKKIILRENYFGLLHHYRIILTGLVLAAQITSSQELMPTLIQNHRLDNSFVSKSIKTGANIMKFVDPLPAGIYTVGEGGYFSEIESAFDRLMGGGILGPVTLSLIDTLYTPNWGMFELIGPISGTSGLNRITIRPAENTAVKIEANGGAVFRFENVDYVTIDGVGLSGNTRLFVHGQTMDGIRIVGDCAHNVIQNVSVASDNLQEGWGIVLGPFDGTPDSCIISGVSIKSGSYGILILGDQNSKPTKNIVCGNQIGSPTDSLVALGIVDQLAYGTIIENNHVENLRLSTENFLQTGICSYQSLYTIIRNNIVHNICNSLDKTNCIGILAFGDASNYGSNVWIYNNKVWDIRNMASQAANLSGIRAYYLDSLRAEYNTVYLTECGDVPPAEFSNALRATSGIYPIVRNNILVNTRDDYPAYSTAITLNSTSSISDYNDLHVGSGSTAYIAMRNTSKYKSLANWQATNKDLHSISVCPMFCSGTLHIDSTNSASFSLDGKAIPIAEILTDFEGQPRSTMVPDIGADEFEVTIGVVEERGDLPTAFTLSQNYPNPFNPSTIVEFQLSKESHVSLSVFDLLGREVAVLVNEKKDPGRYSVQWDASGYSSGVYFYRLEAGIFVETKKLVLLR